MKMDDLKCKLYQKENTDINTKEYNDLQNVHDSGVMSSSNKTIKNRHWYSGFN